MRASASDVSEGAGGGCPAGLDGFTSRINVTVGQTYVLLVNNYDNNSRSFNLSFQNNASSTAVLSCTPLPVHFFGVKATYDMAAVSVSWRTSYESNLRTYHVQRLIGEDWKTVSETDPGKSSYSSGINEYRVVSYDYDDVIVASDVVSVYVESSTAPKLYPNPSAGKFYVEAEKDATVDIFDVAGRLVHHGAADKTGYLSLQSGLYKVVVSENGVTTVFTLVMTK